MTNASLPVRGFVTFVLLFVLLLGAMQFHQLCSLVNDKKVHLLVQTPGGGVFTKPLVFVLDK
jgi:hypothetical protein